MDLPAILSEVPLLADLDRKTIKRLAEQGKQRTYEAGQHIVNQGDPASAIYFLLHGRVRVEHEADGETTVLGELVPHAFFGELALIEQTPRTASVIAVEETTCFLLLAWEFTALLKENPAMSDVLLRQMIGRLHRKEHHVF